MDIVDTHQRFVDVRPATTISNEEECERTIVARKYWYQTGGSTWYQGSTWFYYGQWVDSLVDYCTFPLPDINAPSNMTRLRVAARIRDMDTEINKRVNVFVGAYPN